MSFNRLQKIVAINFVWMTAYWGWLQVYGYKETNWNYFYSFAFSLVPLIGGAAGVRAAELWGGLRSGLGKAITYFSAGLFAWGFGSMIWAYYNFIVHEPAPYPSVADLAYVVALGLWAAGLFYLSKASGARFSLRRSGMKLAAALVALVVAAVSYDLIINVAREGRLLSGGSTVTQILDIAYPLGDIVILIGSVLIFGLSIKVLGGKYMPSVVVWLLGVGVMYLADFVFSYTTTTGSFYVGNWGDLLFALATSMMTFGVLGFATRPSNKKVHSKS